MASDVGDCWSILHLHLHLHLHRLGVLSLLSHIDRGSSCPDQSAGAAYLPEMMFAVPFRPFVGMILATSIGYPME